MAEGFDYKVQNSCFRRRCRARLSSSMRSWNEIQFPRHDSIRTCRPDWKRSSTVHWRRNESCATSTHLTRGRNYKRLKRDTESGRASEATLGSAGASPSSVGRISLSSFWQTHRLLMLGTAIVVTALVLTVPFLLRRSSSRLRNPLQPGSRESLLSHKGNTSRCSHFASLATRRR